MARKSNPERATEVLQALHEFLVGEEPDFGAMAAGELTAYLENHELDPKRVRKDALDALAEARGREALANASAKRLKLLSRARLPATWPRLRDSLIAEIRSLVGTEQAAVYMRKFEDAPDEDLQSLIEDLRTLSDLDG